MEVNVTLISKDTAIKMLVNYTVKFQLSFNTFLSFPCRTPHRPGNSNPFCGGSIDIFWNCTIPKPQAAGKWFTNSSSVVPTSQVVYQPITHRNLWSIAFI